MSSLNYFDPQGSDRGSWNYARRGLGTIPREQNEKVLIVGENEWARATEVVAIINEEYSVIRNRLRRVVTEKFGIGQERDSLQGWSSELDAVEELRPWPPLGEGLALIRNSDMTFATPNEFEITSQPYNK